MKRYRLQSPRSCGLDALHAALDNAGYKRDRAEIADLFGWRETGDVRSDILDNPANHKYVLDKLGVPWRWVKCNDILSGKCANGKTVILVHAFDAPNLAQHWVILSSVANGVVLEFGDGTFRPYSPEKFAKLYAGGDLTNTAYEIGIDGKTRIARIYAWLNKAIKSIFGR